MQARAAVPHGPISQFPLEVEVPWGGRSMAIGTAQMDEVCGTRAGDGLLAFTVSPGLLL